METKKRLGIGKKAAALLSGMAEKNRTIFTNDEAVNAIGGKKSSVTKLLHDLTRNRWLLRLSKGKYLIMPLEAGVRPEFTEHEFVIASILIAPYYISYWSALNYYGFTEQVPKAVFLATIKRKREMGIAGLKFKFITIKKSKFFGFKKTLINSHPVNIAEKEKAIIDCLDLPRYCGGISEAVKAIDSAREEIDFKKLEDYAKRMKNNAVINRLGYILDMLGIKTGLKPCRHYVMLDPLIKKKLGYNAKWKIIETLPKEELQSWRGH